MVLHPRFLEITNVTVKDFDGKQICFIETRLGRHLKVSPSTLEVILQMDGQNSIEEIAQQASQRLKMDINPQQVNNLIDQWLVPQHLLESNPEVPIQKEHVWVHFREIERCYAEAVARICEVAIEGFMNIYRIDILKRHSYSTLAILIQL